MAENEFVLTAEEAAALMRISAGQVRKLCRQGKLKHYRAGERGGLRLLRENVERFMGLDREAGDDGVVSVAERRGG